MQIPIEWVRSCKPACRRQDDVKAIDTALKPVSLCPATLPVTPVAKAAYGWSDCMNYEIFKCMVS